MFDLRHHGGNYSNGKKETLFEIEKLIPKYLDKYKIKKISPISSFGLTDNSTTRTLNLFEKNNVNIEGFVGSTEKMTTFLLPRTTNTVYYFFDPIKNTYETSTFSSIKNYTLFSIFDYLKSGKTYLSMISNFSSEKVYPISYLVDNVIYKHDSYNNTTTKEIYLSKPTLPNDILSISSIDIYGTKLYNLKRDIMILPTADGGIGLLNNNLQWISRINSTTTNPYLTPQNLSMDIDGNYFCNFETSSKTVTVLDRNLQIINTFKLTNKTKILSETVFQSIITSINYGKNFSIINNQIVFIGNANSKAYIIILDLFTGNVIREINDLTIFNYGDKLFLYQTNDNSLIIANHAYDPSTRLYTSRVEIRDTSFNFKYNLVADENLIKDSIVNALDVTDCYPETGGKYKYIRVWYRTAKVDYAIEYEETHRKLIN